MTTRRKKTPDPAPAAEPPAITAANLAEFIASLLPANTES